MPKWPPLCNLVDMWKLRGSKSIGWLTLLLICSGALNVALLGAMCYTQLFQCPSKVTRLWRPATIPTTLLRSNVEVVAEFEQLSRYQLTQKLLSTQLIEDGFSERDLALSCLVSLHHFDIRRALGEPPREVRTLAVPDRTEGIPLFPALGDEGWRSICDFAMTERWPLTPAGLYAQIERCEEEIAPSLATAFYLSPPFRALELLFARAEPSPSRGEILQLALEGGWPLLESFTEEQRLCNDLSAERRRHLLFTYLAGGSKVAAGLLLRLDGPHLAHRSGDDEVLFLLSNLEEPTAEAHAFAIELLNRPRSQAVWDLAAEKLKRWTGRSEPEEPAAAVAYTVERGDSLWVVARKLGCTIDELVELNGLKSETIHPGQELQVPDQSRLDAKDRT